MRLRSLWATAAFIAAAALGSADGARPQAPLAEETPESLPDFPGREEAFYSCSACHSFRVVGRQGMSRERWDQTIDWMTEKHAMPKLDGAERELVLGYLEKAFPPSAPRGAGGWTSPFAPK